MNYFQNIRSSLFSAKYSIFLIIFFLFSFSSISQQITRGEENHKEEKFESEEDEAEEKLEKGQSVFFTSRSSAKKNSVPVDLANWRARGPFVVDSLGPNKGVGRVTVIGISPNDTLTIYAVAASGLWKSANEGNSWSLIEDSLCLAYFINYIEIDPQDKNNVYLVADQNIFKSINGGIDWNLIYQGSTIKRLLVNSSSPNILLLMTTSGLIRSTDGGNTWNLFNSQVINQITFKPKNPNIVYGYIGKSFMRSVNGGASFDSITSIPASYGIYEMGVTDADTNRIYIFSTTPNSYIGQVVRSLDGGNNFTAMPSTTKIICFNDMTHLAVSNTNPDELYVGGIELSHSTDGGQNWDWGARRLTNIPWSIPYVHVDHRSIKFINGSFWSGNDGGVYKTQDGGKSFKDKTNMNVAICYSLDCSFIDTSVFIMGNLDNSILLHKGNKWYNAMQGDGFNVAIDPSNQNKFYGKNQNAYQLTSDGGATVSASTTFTGLTESTYVFGTNYPLKFNPQNSNSQFLLVNNLWKTINNGTSVTKLTNFSPGGGFLYVCNTDSNVIYTIGSRTFDGGVTWKTNSRAVRAVDPDEPSKLWSFGTSGSKTYFYYSADTGNTWQTISTKSLVSPSTAFIRCANNSTNGIYLVDGSSVYYIDNRLNNWHPFSNGLSSIAITDLCVLYNHNVVRLSTAGAGVWESPIFDITSATSPVVDFTYNKRDICPGDTVYFDEQVLFNGPSYNPIYSWKFSGGTPSSSLDANPFVVYNSVGVYDVSLKINNSLGTDSITKNLIINVQLPPSDVLPISEDFEDSVFPPNDWSWARNPSSLKIATAFGTFPLGGYALSMKSMQYFAYYVEAIKNDFITSPLIDFSTLSNPQLKYDYCYAYDYVEPDTLKIFYTTDCGSTRNYLKAIGGINLKTDSTYGTNWFYPVVTSWKTDSVDLTLLNSIGSAQIGFEVRSNKRCDIYIDNINISGTVGISEENFTKESSLFFYPNPTRGIINIQIKIPINKETTISLYDFYGREVLKNNVNAKDFEINISNFSNGIYFIELQDEGGRTRKKVAIIR